MRAQINKIDNGVKDGEDVFKITFAMTLNREQMRSLLDQMEQSEIEIDEFLERIKDEV